MKTHPYLRAYMAGIAVPTPFLIVWVTGFTIARTTLRLPLPLEHVIIFPMAVVPNLWGLWNVLRLALGAGDRWPIGLHGAVLPLILMPIVLLLARLLAIDIITPSLAAMFAPFGIVVYYLAWKYLVGYLNEIMGIA
jgi:hypothetical protein